VVMEGGPMARSSVSFDLADEERATLSMWVASHKTEQRLSRRAQVILLSAQGLTLREIGLRSGLSGKNCL
jgi:DNA-binding NarL/FixJ family response regulator